MQINIKKIKNGKLPTYESYGAAGADCYARIDEKIVIKPKTVETIPLGFAVEIPEGYEMQIRGRSGNARKKWVQVFNSPGTIDSDYRGEVGAILYNASDVDFEINPGDRIAQAVVAPVIQAKWEEVEELSETKRGTGGFGSTGISEEKKVEKFYEPFKTVEEAEKFLNKSVIIDGKDEGIVTTITTKRKYGADCLVIEVTLKKSNMREFFSSTLAFTRIKVDGHRFGKEIVGD
jgi:dUTP pyrophosphatase